MKTHKWKLKWNRHNSTYLSPLIILGLVGALALQSIWIVNSYTLTRNIFQRECDAIIENALKQEGNIRFGKAPSGTRIASGKINDTIPPITYFYERLSDMGYPISLEKLDSVIHSMLDEYEIKENFAIHITNLHTGEVVESRGENEAQSWMTIKSKAFPIRTDYTQAVQFIIANPYNTYMERIGLLMLGTAIILILIIGCMIYQVRTIVRFKKIFRIREDFSYAMVHDMKTPLSTIFMTLNFLHSGRLDDKPEMKEKYFKIAESEADHLLTLTNKVLTLSKLESHKLEMEKKEVHLAPLVERLTDKFTAKASKPIHFTIDLQATEAYADEEYLEEVISNLIDNAIKYSKESVEIRISSENSDPYTLIKVHDNGLGIAQNDQRIIFQKYERAAASKRNKKGGAAGFGLGLNFADQVITAHEGKIIVNSIEGEFTEFTIFLPRIIQTL